MSNRFLEVIHKFGYFDAIGTSRVTVWDGGTVYPWPTAANATTIVSTSANDAAAGTGARTVLVEGCTKDGDILTYTTEIATLNGITPVALVNDYYRVFRMETKTAGSGGVAAGNVAVKHDATALAQITATYNQTNMAVYAVPTIYKGLPVRNAELRSWNASAGEGKDADVSLWIRPQNGVFNQKDLRPVFQNEITANYDEDEFIIPAGADIEMRAISSASTTPIAAGFVLKLKG